MRGLLKHCESLAGSGFQAKKIVEEFIKKYHLFFEQKRANIVMEAQPHSVFREFVHLQNPFLSIVVENPVEHCNLHEQETKFLLVWDPGKQATG